jgi:hypothetical protein
LVVWFEVFGPIYDVEPIAIGRSIRALRRLSKHCGHGHWRKLKGWAVVCLEDGSAWRAELHWYEAHGIGRREMKVKRLLEPLR